MVLDLSPIQENKLDVSYDRYINVEDFGAVGDGETDDTVAVQDAINAANGQPVVFTGGKVYYCPSAPLTITKSSSLVCFGFPRARINGYVIYDAPNDQTEIQLENLWIRGTDEICLLLKLPVSRRSIFIDLEFDGGTDAAIRIENSCIGTNWQNILIRNAQNYDVRVDETVNINATQWRSCRFVGTKIAGFRAASTKGSLYEIQFHGCLFEGNYGTGLDIECGVNFNVTGCHFEQNDGYDVIMGSNNGIVPCRLRLVDTVFSAQRDDNPPPRRILFRNHHSVLILDNAHGGASVDGQNQTAGSIIHILNYFNSINIDNFPAEKIKQWPEL